MILICRILNLKLPFKLEILNNCVTSAIGPLTNLAVAYQLDPQIASKIASLTIMGGNMLGIGNVGDFTSEFNFYGDPESAKIVLDKYSQQCPVSVVTWEATSMNTFSSSLLSRSDSINASGRLLNQIKQHSLNNYCMDKDGNTVEDSVIVGKSFVDFKKEGAVLCDLLAAIYCLYPETATVVERFPCTVELDGKYTRAMMIVDRQKSLLPNNDSVILPIRFNMKMIENLSE